MSRKKPYTRPIITSGNELSDPEKISQLIKFMNQKKTEKMFQTKIQRLKYKKRVS